MQIAVDTYFASTDRPSVCGLTLHLGFTSRQSLLNYEGYDPEFLDTIKRAKLRIEHFYEKLLTTPGVAAAGPIFMLKQMGWRDKYSVAHGGGAPLILPPIQIVGR